jgi:hypothetical protein
MTAKRGERPPGRGIDDVLAGTDRVIEGARTVVGKSREFGPSGGRPIGRSAGVTILAWIALYFVARYLLENTSLPLSLRIAVALLPLPAFAWFLWTFIAGVRQADELERRIQLEALAVAFPLTILLFMTLGLLQVAVPLPPEDWGYRHTWPMIYVFYLVGLMLARRRYI